MSTVSPLPALDDPVRLFSALGDPTRLAIVSRLADGAPRSITTLADDTHLTRQAVTKHLHVLNAAGLVRHTRAGRESRYAFNRERLAAAQGYLEAISAQWDQAIERLRCLVED